MEPGDVFQLVEGIMHKALCWILVIWFKNPSILEGGKQEHQKFKISLCSIASLRLAMDAWNTVLGLKMSTTTPSLKKIVRQSKIQKTRFLSTRVYIQHMNPASILVELLLN